MTEPTRPNLPPELETALAGRHPATVGVAKYFTYQHLPEHLQAISGPCANLATVMVGQLSDGPELTVGLRKLLEAKDCFVRQAVED